MTLEMYYLRQSPLFSVIQITTVPFWSTCVFMCFSLFLVSSVSQVFALVLWIVCWTDLFYTFHELRQGQNQPPIYFITPLVLGMTMVRLFFYTVHPLTVRQCVALQFNLTLSSSPRSKDCEFVVNVFTSHTCKNWWFWITFWKQHCPTVRILLWNYTNVVYTCK